MPVAACRKTTNRLRAIETQTIPQQQGGMLNSRKTTNRLRAIETVPLFLLSPPCPAPRVARQLIAFGRLKHTVRRQCLHVAPGRKTTNRLRAIETCARPHLRSVKFMSRKTTNRLRAIETDGRRGRQGGHHESQDN